MNDVVQSETKVERKSVSDLTNLINTSYLVLLNRNQEMTPGIFIVMFLVQINYFYPRLWRIRFRSRNWEITHYNVFCKLIPSYKSIILNRFTLHETNDISLRQSKFILFYKIVEGVDKYNIITLTKNNYKNTGKMKFGDDFTERESPLYRIRVLYIIHIDIK